jgi:hypothetical protein
MRATAGPAVVAAHKAELDADARSRRALTRWRTITRRRPTVRLRPFRSVAARTWSPGGDWVPGSSHPSLRPHPLAGDIWKASPSLALRQLVPVRPLQHFLDRNQQRALPFTGKARQSRPPADFAPALQRSRVAQNLAKRSYCKFPIRHEVILRETRGNTRKRFARTWPRPAK